jgi:hypothetical protein
VEPPQRLTHDVLIPAHIKEKFSNWIPELLGASMVNIHSKVIVCDPFGDNPVVMTGSHNLGFKASTENDDNLVIIEGNKALAAAYAINIIAIFDTYHWNARVQAYEQNPKDPRVWHGLVDNDRWQKPYLQGAELSELKFWFGQGVSAPEAPPVIPRAKRPIAAAARPVKGKPLAAAGRYLPKKPAPSIQVPPPNGGHVRRVTRRVGRKGV